MITVALKVGGEYFRPALHYARSETHARGPINTWHCHDVFHVIYIVKGYGVFRLDNKTVRVGPGLLLFLSPRQWHQFFALSDPFCYDVITFDLTSESGSKCKADFWELFASVEQTPIKAHRREQAIRVPEALRTSVRRAFAKTMLYPVKGSQSVDGARFDVDEAHVDVDDVVRELPRYGSSDMSGVSVIKFLHEIGNVLGHVAPAPEKALARGRKIGVHRGLVDQAVRFINDNFPKPLRLEEIAGCVYLHPVYFSQVFKDEIGLPPRQYLLRIRLNHAKRLLAETEMAVGDIARECGFRTVTYFSRAFREAEGITPSEFRENHKRLRTARVPSLPSSPLTSINASLGDVGLS